MSYIPTLRTPLDTSRGYKKQYGSEKGPGATSRVRFGDSVAKNGSSGTGYTTRTNGLNRSISMNQNDRERRKYKALEFLKRETNETSKMPSSGRVRSHTAGNSLRNDIHKLKTHELLGETPIRNLSTEPKNDRVGSGALRDDMTQNKLNRSLYDEDLLKRIRRESLRRNPLNLGNDNSGRVNKVPFKKTTNHRGLLNSLSDFGSKVFKSIIYQEEPVNYERSQSSPNVGTTVLDQENRQLETQLEAKKRYLNQLNREIDESQNRLLAERSRHEMTGNIDKGIDKTIEKLDEKLQSILEEVNSTSNVKLMHELESVKNELNSLRRRQEANSIKIESRFEDMKLESQLNKQKFEKMMRDLENKRKELDAEKQNLKTMIEKSKMAARTKKEYHPETFDGGDESDHTEKADADVSMVSEDDVDVELDADEEPDSDANPDDIDILKYILKNKRKQRASASSKVSKADRVKHRLKDVKTRMRRLEQISEQTKS